jgi:hypothetical protein
LQLRHFVTIVNNTPCSVGGKKRLETLDGYIIPLSICSGLHYMDMSPSTPSELDYYPNLFLTSDMEWNPKSIVDEYTDHDLDLTDKHDEYHPYIFKAYGELLPVAHQQYINFRNQRRNQPDKPNLLGKTPVYLCQNIIKGVFLLLLFVT